MTAGREETELKLKIKSEAVIDLNERLKFAEERGDEFEKQLEVRLTVM